MDKKTVGTEHFRDNILLKTVIDTVLDGLIIINEQGVIQHINPAVEKTFGYAYDELIGENVKILMPDPYYTEHDRYLKNHIETGVKKIIGIGREVLAKKKDGTIFPIDLGINKMILAGKIMFVGTLKDISEQKQSLEQNERYVFALQSANEKLEERESQIKAIVDTTVDGIITINHSGIIESFNQACQDIFGYTADEVIGKNVKVLMPEPYHGEHDSYLKNYSETGEKKIIGIGREVSAKKKDGTIFPIDLSIAEVFIKGSRRYSGIIRDITLRKIAEQKIQEYINALRSSNQELDDFAYIASHDLKEPLRGLSNNAIFLKEDYGDTLEQAAIKRLDHICDLCRRMENLIDDLLYFSRLGTQALAIQEVNLNQAIDDVTSMMTTLLNQENVTVSIPQPLPNNIICDAPRITEVFRNLISNAIKYNKSENKIIEIGSIPPQEISNQDIALTDTVLYVKDNGIGIADEFHDEVFRIFKRLNNEDESIRGTGVGLTFVKKIVEKSNGRIWIESKLNIGTTIYFTIPKVGDTIG